MLVSIMMPAYNAASYIDDAINSILDQTYMNWELIIVDDGSDDDTYTRALAYRDHRIMVLRQPHKGCPAARNACISKMRGAIFVRQDADDLSDKRRIERQTLYLLQHPECELVSCRMRWLVGDKLIPKKAMPMQPNLYLAGKGGSPVCASIVAWRRVYDKVGYFDETMLAGSDGDWNFRVLKAGMKFGYLDEPLYVQRRHVRQLSQAMRENQRENHERARISAQANPQSGD